MSKKYDLIVLGSGPGGYVTAIRASQLGLKTAIIEKESLGGVCLNWGCIPTKALLKSAQVFEYLKNADSYGLKIKDFDKDFESVVKRSRNVADGMSKGVNFLMKKNKIDVITGYGKILPNKNISVENNGQTENFEANNIVIATGGRSRVIESIPQDGKKIIGYREAMTLQKQPKKMIIVGSGAIGIEFAYFYNSMGTEVKVVEYMDRVLPVEDKDVSNQLNRTFKKSGIKIRKVIFTIPWLLFKLFFWRMKEKYIIRNFHPLVLFYFTGFMFFLLSSTLAIRLVYLWLDYGYVPVMTALALLFTSSNAILFSLFAMWFDMEVNKDLK